MSGHTWTYCALSLAPLTALYYQNPGLGVAVTAALATVIGALDVLRRRKTAP